MNTYFDWFAWHRCYREDEWFLSLTPGQRWAWVAFLSWANETDWYVTVVTPLLLSRRIEADPDDIQGMLDSAIEAGKVLIKDGKWFVKNGDKYRPGKPKKDSTNAERQARHRNKKKEVTPLSDNVTPLLNDVTDSNAVTPLRNAIPVKTEKSVALLTNTEHSHSLDSLENESISNTAKSSRAPARGGGQVVDNSNGNGRASPTHNATTPDFISRTTEFLDELSELVSLSENDRLGIRFDVIKRGSTEGLHAILDQLRMAEADGRLGCLPGIVNPVGWIRKRIREEVHVEPG